MMTHCIICFEEGTYKHPLIKPCKSCNIEAHNECILNLVSTHLLSKRNIIENRTIVKPFRDIFFFTLDGILVIERPWYIRVQIKPFHIAKSNYFKFFQQDITTSDPPGFSIADCEDVCILEDIIDPTIYVLDKCPQCKRHLEFTSRKKSFNPLRLLFKSDIWAGSFEVIKYGLFGVISLMKLPRELLFKVLKELYCSMCVSFMALPWVFLGRDIEEYQNLFELDNPLKSLVVVYDIMLLSSKKFVFFDPTVLIRLFFIDSARATIPGLVHYLAIFNKIFGGLIYSFTFNSIYFDWTLELYPDIISSYLGKNAMSDKLDDISKGDKFFLCSAIDFRDVFINRLDAQLETNNWMFSKHVTSDLPFDSIILTVCGINFGNKILGKCKPLIKLLYKFLKNYRPIPVEIELILEYFGYECMLLLKTFHDFYIAYLEYTSLKTYIDFPTSDY